MNFTRIQWFGFAFVLILSIGFFIAVYLCPGRDCLGKIDFNVNPTADFEAFLQGHIVTRQYTAADLNKKRDLNFEGEDVLVYLHVQKTGGSTFGKNLVQNLDFIPPCICKEGIKKCSCYTKNNRIWLVSRHSTGWICGLHADWTELTDCVEEWFLKNDVESRKQRRYHYITFVRNPVDRFLSEWQHVSRGATWKSVRLHCNGRSATIEELPFCYTSEDWKGVTFDQFIGCKHNLAFNRMTRMLADMSKVNCYNNSHLERHFVEQTMLQSAKENLLTFAFFGLLEYLQATQFLFEKTFGLNFIDNFEQREKTHVTRITVTQKMRNRVIENNRLDIYFYQFAKDLFLQRVKAMEEYLGYTVEEYFDHIRDIGDAERSDKAVLFEDVDESIRDPQDETFPSEEAYPSRARRDL